MVRVMVMIAFFRIIFAFPGRKEEVKKRESENRSGVNDKSTHHQSKSAAADTPESSQQQVANIPGQPQQVVDIPGPSPQQVPNVPDAQNPFAATEVVPPKIAEDPNSVNMDKNILDGKIAKWDQEKEKNGSSQEIGDPYVEKIFANVNAANNKEPPTLQPNCPSNAMPVIPSTSVQMWIRQKISAFKMGTIALFTLAASRLRDFGGYLLALWGSPGSDSQLANFAQARWMHENPVRFSIDFWNLAQQDSYRSPPRSSVARRLAATSLR